MTVSSVDLTMVVPFYNPGDSLGPTVDQLVRTLREGGLTFEVICVSDGSTDGAEVTVEGRHPEVFVVRLDHNTGKGAALRRGFAVGRGRYVGFIDADGDLPPAQIASFMAHADGKVDAIVGSKRHPASRVEQSLVRHLYSWAWQLLTATFFRLEVNDTQVGIKLFRREMLRDVLPRTREVGFAFDVELLAVARVRGFINVIEVPVVIVEGARSTVSFWTGLAMLWRLARIFLRLHVFGTYERAVEEALPATS